LVKDTKYQDLREEFPPLVYAPISQFSDPDQPILIRSRLPLDVLVSEVKQVTLQANPDISLMFDSLENLIHNQLVGEGLMATLSGFFGLLAALLATLGLYGVMSYSVLRRTNEIGIRMTLGASRVSIIGMVVREAGMLLLAGLCAGIPLSIAGGRTASSLLFGLKPYDPLTLAAAALLLAAVAAAAGYLPARRATRVDPMEALRYE